jgi:ribA/ribD-fused uncharacterized protein
MVSDEVQEEGVVYHTAEHYMMVGKARLFNDQESSGKIRQSVSPSQAKSLGRKVKNFDPKIWDEYKYDLVKKEIFKVFSEYKM